MEHFSRRPIRDSEPESAPSESKNPEFTSRKVTPHKIHASLFRRIIRTIPTNKSEYQEKKVPFFLLSLVTLITAGVILWIGVTSYQYLTNFQVTDLIKIFSAELAKDENEHTNLLLLGTGGGDHDGADLTDTMIIASLNHTKKSVSFLSIPRDLWIDMPGYGSSRINKIYETLKVELGSDEALKVLKQSVEQITHTTIPYYLKIDFAVFIDVIDTLGGIEVEVPKSIIDTEYPKEDNSGYETFSINAGKQILDGKTALKYARSRHSTSDFDRAERQQEIIKAIKQKINDLNLLSSPLTLKKLYDQFEEHVETNLNTTELITLARFGKDLEQDKLTSAVIKDIDVIDAGSFLYTPERKLYGGAFVLRPLNESFEDIQLYVDLIFNYPEYLKENARIQVLNGTKKSGLAFLVGQKLIPFGMNIQRYDNAPQQTYQKTVYYIHHPENTLMSEIVLKKILPEVIKESEPVPNGINTEYDITIIAGDDIVVQE